MMDYLPGPHKKIFADCEKLQAYIREEVTSHKQTLDPENPRDYIDCFLIKLAKVAAARSEDRMEHGGKELMELQEMYFLVLSP
ncbi:hypothetical protein JD844_011742 [Phrynosoma platyrhinos]|uniref:Uncharacterized protein n=1 Tax=Phrynosoma platyrhinos TaxID=52577 RepID=A0ABQ7TJM9_PHRPL|nr:hypothetical protein JD844_011742 [Phrynosoma platyrhinos]